MNAFVTGSRAYGTPKSDSDVDLVILTDPYTADMLMKQSDGGKIPIRFGNLNLVVCTDPAEFAIWKVGTEIVKHKNLDDRDAAKEVFAAIRDATGRKMPDDY
jgi:hypothetical protein